MTGKSTQIRPIINATYTWTRAIRVASIWTRAIIVPTTSIRGTRLESTWTKAITLASTWTRAIIVASKRGRQPASYRAVICWCRVALPPPARSVNIGVFPRQTEHGVRMP